MNSAAVEPTKDNNRVWILWLSIAVQQVVFLSAFRLRVQLVSISEWVIYVPVVIVWVLYIVVPLLMAKKRESALLRAYSVTGWIFVVAAVSWSAGYIALSQKYGIPVSWDEVQWRRQWVNQAGPSEGEKVMTLLGYFRQGQQLSRGYLQDKTALLQAESSVVRILVNYNKNSNSSRTVNGSGCLVKGGLVLTAGHCLDVLDEHPDAQINVILVNGEKLSASLVGKSDQSDRRSGKDWGLLRIYKHSEMGLSFGHRAPNSPVVIMGYPGRIGFNQSGEPRFEMMDVTRPLYPAILVCRVMAVTDSSVIPMLGSIPIGGMSGAPMLDLAGNIVGIGVGVTDDNTTGKSTINVAFVDAAMEAVQQTINLPK